VLSLAADRRTFIGRIREVYRNAGGLWIVEVKTEEWGRVLCNLTIPGREISEEEQRVIDEAKRLTGRLCILEEKDGRIVSVNTWEGS
jgi:hypothetical protein